MLSSQDDIVPSRLYLQITEQFPVHLFFSLGMGPNPRNHDSKCGKIKLMNVVLSPLGINLVFKSKHPPSLSRMFVYDGTRRGKKIDKGIPRYEHLHLATFPSLERIRGYCLITWPLAGGCDCVLER